jgi:hypothetical protein
MSTVKVTDVSKTVIQVFGLLGSEHESTKLIQNVRKYMSVDSA